MSSLFFNPSTNGFHEKNVGGCIEITKKRKAELMQGQADGKPISSDESGNPINIDPPAPTNELILQQRQRAYADPLTGSDRFFVEASRMQLSGEQGFAEVQQAGLARYAEIKSELPFTE